MPRSGSARRPKRTRSSRTQSVVPPTTATAAKGCAAAGSRLPTSISETSRTSSVRSSASHSSGRPLTLVGRAAAETSIDPSEAPMGSRQPLNTEEQLQAVTLEPLIRLTGPIELAESDPAWPHLYARETDRIRSLLGDDVQLLEMPPPDMPAV